ncbi:MAG: hypothetical protein H8E08_00650 [Candidatus Marinimicrobia bacterium]|nr:hypothetical protein [Candidatus Neomarinimicrobiota bacterium]
MLKFLKQLLQQTSIINLTFAIILTANKKFATLTILVLLLLIQNCNEPNNIEEFPSTWKNLGLESKHIIRLRLFKPYLYACTGYDGLWRKDIQKKDSEWKYMGFSNSNFGQELNYGVVDIVVNPENIDIMLVAFFPDSGTAHGIFKTEDGGNSWFVSDSGLGFHFPEPWDDETYYEHPTIFLQSPNMLFAAGTEIAKSIDFGDTWEVIGSIVGPAPAAWTFSFTYHRESTNILWLGGTSATFGPLLFFSEDSGANWDYVFLDSLVVIDNTVYSIALDPNNIDIAYVSLFREIIKTIDGGTSWTKILSWDGPGHVRGLVEDDSQSGHLFAAAGPNVMETKDGGETWVDIDSPNGSGILSMVFDSDENALYIGTANASAPSGVFIYK